MFIKVMSNNLPAPRPQGLLRGRHMNELFFLQDLGQVDTVHRKCGCVREHSLGVETVLDNRAFEDQV
jgi:hypothetical protein